MGRDMYIARSLQNTAHLEVTKLRYGAVSVARWCIDAFARAGRQYHQADQ
jgi:hypothetical protein